MSAGALPEGKKSAGQTTGKRSANDFKASSIAPQWPSNEATPERALPLDREVGLPRLDG